MIQYRNDIVFIFAQYTMSYKQKRKEVHPMSEKKKLVTVYTTTPCMQCEFTKKELDRHNIPYKTVPIDNDEVSNYIKHELNFMSAPVIVLSKALEIEPFSGFQPEKLKQIKEYMSNKGLIA